MQTRCARLARSSALIRYRVPGPKCQVPGTWKPVPGTCLRKTRTRGMQILKRVTVFGSRSSARHLTLPRHSITSSLRHFLLPYCRIALWPIALTPGILYLTSLFGSPDELGRPARALFSQQ